MITEERHIAIEQYKDRMSDIIRLIIPISKEELDPILDYSINKRYKEYHVSIENSYTKRKTDMTLLMLTDYIISREPIVTAYGTMFKKHGTVPNPMAVVIQQFLDKRSEDKKKMFKYPKGSEMFEKYNLAQQLDKIDCNGIYGVLGMYTSALFNINVATSVTTQGRAMISTATMFLESFLANNVKFGSLDQVLEFIVNVTKEDRKYRDEDILDHPVSIEDCFGKIILSCGYRWVPNEKEMDIIWRVINNLGQYDLNRVYYKNNLYEFMDNRYMKNIIISIMKTLDTPFFNSLEPPANIIPMLDELTNLLREFVVYNYMYIDRIDRCDNMIKSVIAVSDTDSVIVSMDAWYRYIIDMIDKDCGFENLKILRCNPIDAVKFFDTDEFGDYLDLSQLSPIYFDEPEESYDFKNDKIIEIKHAIDPLKFYTEDYMRFTIINILSYSVGILMNQYIEKLVVNNHAMEPGKKCKMYLKTEFNFARLMLTNAKKNYASIVTIQEGHVIPKSQQLDIKGIASMAKSSMSESTRNSLKRILLEDALDTPVPNQFQVIKDLSIFERKIIENIQSGSREYYKPVVIKGQSNYKDPMRIQGVKAATVWNSLKSDDYPAINLDERNSIDIAKIKLNQSTIDSLKQWPTVYENAQNLLQEPLYKGNINAIAIPLDVTTPDWLLEIIDYSTIVNDNIGGFPYESLGIVKLSDATNFSNILQL